MNNIRNIINYLVRCLFLGLLILSGPLAARTIYVSASGNDSNNGSRNNPIRTLDRAKQICKNSNDSEFTILLRGGDTFRNFTRHDNDDLNGRSDPRRNYAFLWDLNKKLTLSTYGPDKRAKLLGDKYVHNGGPPSCIGISKQQRGDVLIENLHIEEWQVNAITISRSEDVTVRNCFINKIGQIYFPNERADQKELYVAGVVYPLRSENLLFENLIITNCHNYAWAAPALHGFYPTRVRNTTIRKIYMKNLSGSPLKWRRLFSDREKNNSTMEELYCYYTGHDKDWEPPSGHTEGGRQPGWLRISSDSRENSDLPNSNCPFGLTIKNSVFWYPYCYPGFNDDNCDDLKAQRCSVAHNYCGDSCNTNSQVRWINNDYRYDYEDERRVNIPTPEELGIGTGISNPDPDPDPNPGSGNKVTLRKRNAMNYAIDGGNGGENQQNVKLWSFQASNVNQHWEEIDRGNGFYSYRKDNTDYCLDGNNGGENGQSVYLYRCSASNQNQQWKKIDEGNGYYRLEKRNDRDFALDGGNGGDRGQDVKLWSSNGSNQNQEWKIENVSSNRIANFATNEVLTLELYPNPAIESIKISLPAEYKKGSLSIYDASGKRVLIPMMSSLKSASEKTIDISNLAPGMYFVKALINNTISVKKLVKH